MSLRKQILLQGGNAPPKQTTQPVGQPINATAVPQKWTPPQSAGPVGQPISATAVPSSNPTPSVPTQPPANTSSSSSGGMSYTNITPPPAVERPTMTAGGSTNASAQPFQYDQFREFGDSVMQEYERNIEPELEQRRARVNQDLVNKGLTPGSEAYEREMDRFMRMENDLFQTAQRGALEQGLAAQNQAFGQSLGQANINAGLKTAKMGADASMYGADMNRAGSLERLLAGLGQQESEFSRGLDQRESEFGRNLGQRESEFGRSFGLQSGQADFGNLMDILGFGLSTTDANNQALANDRQTSAGLVGGFQPGSPFVPINAGGAFNTTLNAQNSRANIRQGNSDRLASGIGSLGSAFLMSDRDMKTDIEDVDNDEVLESLRKVPVSRWSYKGDIRVHIGPMAQDFGANVTDEPEAREIWAVDAIGSLISSVQSLAEKFDSMADRIDAMEANNAV